MTQPVVANPLEPLWEDWQRGLAIVAHPDDLEFGAAAAIARWTGQGKQLVYCLVTSGEAGIDAMAPAQARRVREAEQRTSAAVVGVTVVEFLSQPDGGVEYGVPLRRALARGVRRHRPEIVITTNFRDTWDGAVGLNQADHRATGWAVLDAVRDAGNRWVFPELLAEGLEPWGGVTQVWAAGSPDARHGVDITATFAQGVASLRAHEAYLRGLRSGTCDPETYLAGLGRAAGTRLGTHYGAVFEVFPCAAHSGGGT
jgi:LmbE family N-acetylglucosaminyl deacetylase